MKEIVIAIITTIGLIIASYFSYRGFVASRETKKELVENSGTSALDKIKSTITDEITELRHNIDRRLDSFDRRFDTFDRRASNTTDRFNRLDIRSDNRDKTLMELMDELQELKVLIDKIKDKNA